MKNNASEHMVIAGLLHDVVEDEDITLTDIRDKFGGEVATLVDVASEPEELINADGAKVRPDPSARHIPLTLSKMQTGT
jgi:(p)ppGpp synthase/HD superfamily hydrolase